MRALVLVSVLSACFVDEDSDLWGPTPEPPTATSAQRDHGSITFVTDDGPQIVSLDVRVLRQFASDTTGNQWFDAWVLDASKPFRCEADDPSCIHLRVLVPPDSGIGARACPLGTSAEIRGYGMYLDTDGRRIPDCAYEVVDDDSGPYVSIQNLVLTWNGHTIRADVTGKL